MDPDLAALERAVRAEPADAAAKTRLAHAYAQAGRPAEAYLTWLDLGQEPPAAVTEAAFVAQEDTLRGLAGWCRVGGSKELDDKALCDPQRLLVDRRPLLVADLHGGLEWGAEDAIDAVTRIQTLKRLSFPCDEVAPPLDLLTRLPALKHLHLSGEHVDDATLEPVSRLRGLRSLTLRCPRLRDGWPAWLERGAVQVLRGTLSGFGDAGLNLLARVVSIEVLSLSCGDDVTDQGLGHLARLESLGTLTLQLPAQVRGTFLAAFANHDLQELTLQGGTIDPVALQVLEGMPNLRRARLPTADNTLLSALGKSHLQSLQFDYTQAALDDDGLRALGQSNALKTLALGWSSGVTGVGFSAWSPGLVELSGSAGFDDDGARALQHLTTLEVVDLEHAERLTDEGLAALATLPALRSLTITGEVTDLGLRALHGHPSLRSLTIKEGITGPNLTEGALDGLVATVPGLEVFRQGFY